MKIAFPSTLSLTALAVTGLAAQLPQPPSTRAVAQVDRYHGTAVADPYRWLEDDSSAETAAWVKRQNEVTFAYLTGLPRRSELRQRLTMLDGPPEPGLPARLSRVHEAPPT